ncbi:hypothetical protein MMC09_004534 [Bachmanniomyces sp. S44760]|nr:hypothetical protein [Bachmanniomyces sp. S44760]
MASSAFYRTCIVSAFIVTACFYAIIPISRNLPDYEEDSFQDVKISSDSTSAAVPEDPLITTWSALGDSYACGVGAGSPIHISSGCGRFSQAYPSQLNRQLGEKTNFNYLACSGAKIADTIPQAYDLSNEEGKEDGNPRPDPEFATLTIGGNDIGFFAILNACIYRFDLPSSSACAASLANAQLHLDTILPLDLDDAISTIMTSAQIPDFKLFVTGYPEFFNQDSKSCDKLSFNYWPLPDVDPRKTFLTREVRTAANELVRSLNGRIEEAVGRANFALSRRSDTNGNGKGKGKKVVYVDYNPYFQGHRFCEAEAEAGSNAEKVSSNSEPDARSDRAWFYTLGSSDTDTDTVPNNGNSLADPNPNSPPPPPRPPQQYHHDPSPKLYNNPSPPETWAQSAARLIANAKAKDPSLIDLERASQPQQQQPCSSQSPQIQILTLEFVRIFHPKIAGHEAIARAVLDSLMDDGLDGGHYLDGGDGDEVGRGEGVGKGKGKGEEEVEVGKGDENEGDEKKRGQRTKWCGIKGIIRVVFGLSLNSDCVRFVLI